MIKPVKPLPELIESGLMMKETQLVELFIALRNMLIELAPDSHELPYHTHALTSVFSHSKKLKDAFCHIPVYTNHLNLGFNKGALLSDPDNLLEGTGKLIRHIPVRSIADFDNEQVRGLIKEAINQSRPNT